MLFSYISNAIDVPVLPVETKNIDIFLENLGFSSFHE
jgi:hypothetical protein